MCGYLFYLFFVVFVGVIVVVLVVWFGCFFWMVVVGCGCMKC